MGMGLPDGYSQNFRSFVFGPLGLKDYGSAPLRCKIGSLPFLGLRPHALRPGAIQGKEGIKFCHLATLVEKTERKSDVRGNKKMPEKSQVPKSPERPERPSDYFSKFDASVRVNAEKARSTLDRLKLDDSEGCDDEDTEALNGEGMFQLRKWSS